MISFFWWMLLSGLFSCNTINGNNALPVSAKIVTDTANRFAWKPVHYDSSKTYIYLTFDDGPQHGTMACFDLCRQMGVKATFFMVGLHEQKKSDGNTIVGKIRDAYPQILLANHSFTHANDKYIFFYKHPQMAEEDFYQAQQSLHVPYKIARLPGNSAWVSKGRIKASGLVKPVCNLLDSAGYNVIGWDLEWNFNHKTANPIQSPEKMMALVDTALVHNRMHTAKHLVILSHDRMFRNPQYTDSLAKFISLLKQRQDFIFETVDHYPGLKPF
ncbi:MAG: polysaccharide deacetylase family protein [Bacteroidota bacterium]|nr:polysaccharide deacetylase family protein [Bacteroidota bacterium]